MLAEIWHWSHDALEAHHDYIQWLFPLRTASSANRHAPRVTDDDIAQWLDDPMLRMNLRRSLEVMLQFYGLRLTHADGMLTVVLASNARERQLHWLTPSNHNYLRLTRIIRSLELLGAPELATALRQVLERLAMTHHAAIDEQTVSYWRGER
jgi:hypothetical protein